MGREASLRRLDVRFASRGGFSSRRRPSTQRGARAPAAPVGGAARLLLTEFGMNVALPQDPVPLRPVNQVRVIIPHDVAYNLEKLQKVMASVLGRLGCQGCTAGFDIRF